jgi:hypothetical protein
MDNLSFLVPPAIVFAVIVFGIAILNTQRDVREIKSAPEGGRTHR